MKLVFFNVLSIDDNEGGEDAGDDDGGDGVGTDEVVRIELEVPLLSKLIPLVDIDSSLQLITFGRFVSALGASVVLDTFDNFGHGLVFVVPL